jgi:hypothetical protein
MGFTPRSARITIDFPEDHELHGLEVVTTSVPFGTFLDLSTLADGASGDGVEAMQAMARLISEFADKALRSWNLDDENGQHVPEGVDGLRSLDTRHVLAIVGAWMRAAGGEVPAPLGATSPAGGPSAVELPPMAPLSASQAS